MNYIYNMSGKHLSILCAMSDEVPVMLLATAADVALPSIGMTFGAIYICTAVGLM